MINGDKTSNSLPALFKAGLLTALLFTQSACADASDKPQVSIHDPVMAEQDGRFYLFSTGPGITYYQSDDLLNWQLAGRVFSGEPDWAKRVSPTFDGHIWAPDIFQHNGQFYLYYSVSAFGKNTSAIGVTVNKTLDKSSPDYQWQDKGIVVESVPHRDLWNAIDPNIIAGDNGEIWMSFGSFWSGLKLVKLADDLTSLAEPQQWHTIAKAGRPAFTDDAEPGPGDLEAPFIFKQHGYYYLFVSYGKCCRGNDSTYHLVVGRSENVTGPYLDKNGKSLAEGGGTVLLKGNRDWPGLGHNSAYTFNGKDYLVFHAYEAADNGLQKLKIAEIQWDDAKWPLVSDSVLNEYRSVLHPVENK
ncbi:arabinan endo-1,5-alpha-L-arabinosidase [Chromatiaceae bacterium AAb-1]|nr:arabinan endo-1,5-alpha-L-arabinosidase [Chromatiaceae bacterium AAb-1]